MGFPCSIRNMLTGVMVDVVGTTAQMEQEEQSLKMLKRDIADVVPWISFQLVKPPFFLESICM